MAFDINALHLVGWETATSNTVNERPVRLFIYTAQGDDTSEITPGNLKVENTPVRKGDVILSVVTGDSGTSDGSARAALFWVSGYTAGDPDAAAENDRKDTVTLGRLDKWTSTAVT